MPLSITLFNVQMQVIEAQADDGPDGPEEVKVLAFLDPASGMQVQIPLKGEEVDRMVSQLTASGKIHVASTMPSDVDEATAALERIKGNQS